jgi:hypothetical protein
MNPRVRAALQLAVLIVVTGGLLLLFPSTARFVEIAARELRYLWWLILLVALACWLIWGAAGRRRNK